MVTLTWTSPVDLDLYVTDSTWETVYFGNNPSRAGGRLERDERCAEQKTTTARVEIVRLMQPRDGPYRVGVDFIDTCGSGTETASFRVVAAVRGAAREVTAMATTNVFAPVVLEFEVRHGGDGTLTIDGGSSRQESENEGSPRHRSSELRRRMHHRWIGARRSRDACFDEAQHDRYGLSPDLLIKEV